MYKRRTGVTRAALSFGVAAAERLPRLHEELLALEVLFAQLREGGKRVI